MCVLGAHSICLGREIKKNFDYTLLSGGLSDSFYIITDVIFSDKSLLFTIIL